MNLLSYSEEALATEEARAQRWIARLGPREALRDLLAENDALIRRPDLDTGRQIATTRSAVYTALMREWAEEQHRAFGYDKTFAVVALGGTGRAEMAPRSDTDFAFLFLDAIEGNTFLPELQRQILHTDTFEQRCGFACRPLPFCLDDVPALTGKQLNAFIDLRPVYDPSGLSGLFRERLRATADPFEHFLHVRSFWREHWERAAGESERLDRFDIKNEGLRVFLAGVWTLAGKGFIHSREVYRTIEDPRDLQAYDFLLRIRAFVHSRKPSGLTPSANGSHAQDLLGFEDFTAFGELLGPEADERARFEYANEVRARLLSARRRVALYAKGIIERELKQGREISPGSPIVYGVGGLHHAQARADAAPREKSRAALGLLLAAQRYGVPVDPAELQTTFRNAGDWLVLTPELSAMFYERKGSLADVFAFLSQVDGAEERLFPGYAQFESSVDDRVLTQRKSLRSALERQKMRALEAYVREGRTHLAEGGLRPQFRDPAQRISVSLEAALLDADHLAAVKLALKTKRLPLTPDDAALRADQTRPLHQRYASGLSGIPLAEYYLPYESASEFTRETVRTAEFLVAQRRAFKERAEAGLNDAQQVAEFALLCGDEHRLRALFVFTCADRTEWESEQEEPTRWFNTRELYVKTLARFRPGVDPARAIETAGYSPDQVRILKDFGEDFFGGVYRQYANRFGAHLVRLVEQPETTGPRASILRDGTSTILGIAAADYRGLAACISGALWHHHIDLRQAHLFSAMNHGLALDFFHLAPREQPLARDLTRLLEEAVQHRRFIGESDEAELPPLTGTVSLRGWRPGQCCLRFETSQDMSGLVYALTYKVYRHLRGNIFGLTAHAARGRAFIAVYHSLPSDLSFEQAESIAARAF